MRYLKAIWILCRIVWLLLTKSHHFAAAIRCQLAIDRFDKELARDRENERLDRLRDPKKYLQKDEDFE